MRLVGHGGVGPSWCASIGNLSTNYPAVVPDLDLQVGLCSQSSLMGNRESTPSEEPVGDSQLQHYAHLFRDLTAPDHSGHPIDDKIFRVSNTNSRPIFACI